MKQVEVDKNEWHPAIDLAEAIAIIRSLSTNPMHDGDRWSWARNSACKYVSLKFDMRDGCFILLDRDGKRIDFDALLYQIKWDPA